MPDVLQIAMDRREALLKEIDSLDKFIKTANELLEYAARKNQQTTARKPVVSLKPAPLPNGSTPDSRAASPVVSVNRKPVTSQTEAFLRERQHPDSGSASTG